MSAGSAFFIGLAILTKGPVALLVFLMATGVFIADQKIQGYESDLLN